MAPTPSSKAIQPFHTPSKTPNSKHRFHFNSSKHPHPSPNPMFTVKETPQTEHPVEVIGRIRDYADHKEKPVSALNISSDQCSIRVRTETGYRDFSLDGVSVSEEEDLDVFYKKFIQSRINGVKLGAKCTIMMYGPTGAGKSHTMFGCPKQPGIVYMALRDILGEGDEGNDAAAVDSCNLRMGSFVQVTVLEIYNEEIYDLLSNNTGGGIGFGWPKGNASKVRLEVMGKKAKNATYISGNEAGKISREVMKVEKRRIVKSTLCNDRSSRSHCMIILDVPTVGGRLMLVDMAGSENIEQAGQIGLEAKMQTGKINQGNIALKRVVESIANGDSHVPFRDSKLTMLLQDSFEDDKSKILMVLCASPDPREMHKTISTLEYGAKAKCIVRGGHTPNKDKVAEDSSSAVILGSRIAAMDQFIAKLQMENKRYEKEHKEAHKELLKKEEEVVMLRSQIALMERKGPSASEEEISLKVKERTQNMKLELERKIKECEKMANEFVETGKRMMEDKISQQQQELEMLRRRLEEIESVLCRSKDNNAHGSSLRVSEESGLAKRMMEMYADDDRGMIKSMDLDMGDSQSIFVHDVKEVEKGVVDRGCFGSQTMVNPCNWTSTEEIDGGMLVPSFNEKVHLSTVFEEEEEEKENSEEEVEKEVVQETSVQARSRTNDSNLGFEFDTGSLLAPQNLLFTPKATSYSLYNPDEKGVGLDLMDSSKDPVSARKTRIQNIFMLCGNHREMAQHVGTPRSDKRTIEAADVQGKSVSKELQFPTSELEQHDQALSDLIIRNITKRTPKYGNNTPKAADVQGTIGKSISKELQFDPTSENRSDISSESAHEAKENHRPVDEIENKDDLVEVYVKWEASKEHPGKFITKLKAVNGSSLADLRKLIENYLGEDYSKQGFTFLMLGDPTGAPVLKENEATVQTSKLPICNNQLNVHLACLRQVKENQQSNKLPFSSLENKLQNASKSSSSFMQHMDSLSPKVDHLNPVPYVSSGFVR